jgi:hypothetical protein
MLLLLMVIAQLVVVAGSIGFVWQLRVSHRHDRSPAARLDAAASERRRDAAGQATASGRR